MGKNRLNSEKHGKNIFRVFYLALLNKSVDKVCLIKTHKILRRPELVLGPL
jgi:hypothetical protein